MKVFSLYPKDEGWKVIKDSESVSSPDDADLLYFSFPPISKTPACHDINLIVNIPEYQLAKLYMKNFPNKKFLINGEALFVFYKFYAKDDALSYCDMSEMSNVKVAREGYIQETSYIIPVAQCDGVYCYIYNSCKLNDGTKPTDLITRKNQDSIKFLSSWNNYLLSFVDLNVMAKVPNQKFIEYLNKKIYEN